MQGFTDKNLILVSCYFHKYLVTIQMNRIIEKLQFLQILQRVFHHIVPGIKKLIEMLQQDLACIQYTVLADQYDHFWTHHRRVMIGKGQTEAASSYARAPPAIPQPKNTRSSLLLCIIYFPRKQSNDRENAHFALYRLVIIKLSMSMYQYLFLVAFYHDRRKVLKSGG